jgi:hypothetical protein
LVSLVFMEAWTICGTRAFICEHFYLM